VKKIQKKQMKEGGKPKDTESQEESENESKMSVKIKDENSSKLVAKKSTRKTLSKNSFLDPFFFFGLQQTQHKKTFIKRNHPLRDSFFLSS
jgi:hypothetical protein